MVNIHSNDRVRNSITTNSVETKLSYKNNFISYIVSQSNKENIRLGTSKRITYSRHYLSLLSSVGRAWDF